jgi:hypothetical protein
VTVPANVPALEQLPPAAFTHCSLFPTFSQTNGVATVPDNDPIFLQLPPTEAEGLCANVEVEIAKTRRIARQIALVDTLGLCFLSM